MLHGRVLLTGGAGTLGRAIIKRATEEKMDCQLVIFSTDVMKHMKIKRQYPKVQSIIGDIRDTTTLYNAMVGSEFVLHLAARKHIPDAEYNSIDTLGVNVTGSLNVCDAAVQLGIPNVLGISTDKVCHAVNAYGSTKHLMEKIFHEYSRLNLPTQFHLVRYGNVLESTGSVIEFWKSLAQEGKPIRLTEPSMTRFYMSPSQAVDLVLASLLCPNGMTFIPKMKSLSLAKLAEYTIGDTGIPPVIIPIRPGEKMHEELLTVEEGWYASQDQEHGEFRMCKDGYFVLKPTTSERYITPIEPYSSDVADELSKDELLSLLNEK
jgi:UDP-N-acetylglucosamine 4,6-dehydratase